MKKIKIFAIAAAALVMGFTSCSKEGNDPNTDNGEKSYIEVALNFPKSPATKATTDPSAIDAEAEIKNVDVFIFNASGAFLSHTPLTAGDFTATTGGPSVDKYVGSKKVATTTGQRSVLVGINLPASTVSKVKGMYLSDMQSLAISMSRAEAATLTNGLPMFSTAPVTQTVVKDESNGANKFEITAQRFVSKVIVEKSATMTTAGVAGTLGVVEFAISNFNLKTFMIQATDKKDPNWIGAAFSAVDFSIAPALDYTAVLDRAVTSVPVIGNYTARYAMENSSELKRAKEITRAVVRAQFLPTNAHTYTASTLSEVANTNTLGDTYWAVTAAAVGQPTKFFYNKVQAEGYSTANGGATVSEFTNGYNYWAIFLNEKNATHQWDNFRNNMFQCTITKITTPGNSGDLPKEPEVSPSEQTNITVDVNIKFWDTPVLSDHELGEW